MCFSFFSFFIQKHDQARHIKMTPRLFSFSLSSKFFDKMMTSFCNAAALHLFLSPLFSRRLFFTNFPTTPLLTRSKVHKEWNVLDILLSFIMKQEIYITEDFLLDWSKVIMLTMMITNSVSQVRSWLSFLNNIHYNITFSSRLFLKLCSPHKSLCHIHHSFLH